MHFELMHIEVLLVVVGYILFFMGEQCYIFAINTDPYFQQHTTELVTCNPIMQSYLYQILIIFQSRVVVESPTLY